MLKFRHAYYIKLGAKGAWEADALARNFIRFGWRGQSVADINAGKWDKIRGQLARSNVGKPQVATNDLNRLKDIAESTPEDVWVTFHKSKLWWSRLQSGPVSEDSISKYRVLSNAWSDRSETDKLLVASELPGKIAQLQAFRGTVCKVSYADTLGRLLSGVRSTAAVAIAEDRAKLCLTMAEIIKSLHWKDFETLVDLVFRGAGWIRISVLGQQAKGYDLELREPITGHRYVVQVKSQATREDLDETLAQFSPSDYHRVFFVVHTKEDRPLAGAPTPEFLDLVGPVRLAALALDAGLVRWLEDKAE